ncbi:MAG TPA: LLM class flavin-dependent oxidoreductase, partial [Stellaceae bacterium]|nr:LLM class flavin-dependent oxidoreductase [Stellaceae bacterium]
TPRYIAETMLPAVQRGAAKTGRDLSGFTMCVIPLVATAPDRASLDARIADVRSRVAFYASTPAYLIAFENEGYGEVARNLQQLSRAQRWDEMAALVDDGMLDTYAVTGTYDEIAAKLRARYTAVATAIEFAIPLSGERDAAMLRALIAALRDAR